MEKEGVWTDLEFFERALEVAGDGVRDRFEHIIAQARFNIIEVAKKEFAHGMMSPQEYHRLMLIMPLQAALDQEVNLSHLMRTPSKFDKFATQALREVLTERSMQN